MTEEQKNNGRGIKKHRSPNYPFCGLEEAIERAKQVQEAGGIHSVGVNSLMDAWSYKSGTTNSVIAALKAYGLVSVSGEGELRQVKLTEEARKILAEHSETKELLKIAALSPPLYKELWEKYDGHLPPSDKVIREYLVFDRNFNQGVVDGIIKDFRNTISFANLNSSDKMEEQAESETDNSMNTGQTHRQYQAPAEVQPLFDDFFSSKPTANKQNVKPLFEYSVPLSIQREVNAKLRIDGQKLKKKDLEILAKRVKELIDAFEEEEEENIVRLKAVWHNNDFDIPVVVTSNPERAADGNEYVAIEGSDSRIPYDEVEFDDE